MGTKRLAEIPGFGIDRIARAAGQDPEVLRLENLDTDVPPHPAALKATRDAVDTDDANSWLPFRGKHDLREAVAGQQLERAGVSYDPLTQIVITSGEGDGMVDALFATTDPGDEVILTDPTYAGMINRVRIVGAVPRMVPLGAKSGEWRLDLDALGQAAGPRTRAVFVANPGMPTGNVLSEEEWEAIASLCRERDLWLIHLAWMERILFDDRTSAHPASLSGMADRVITVGCVSMEQRMIGWRIGWVVAPEAVADDVTRAHIYNGLTAGGIAQAGATAALKAPPSDLDAAVAEWQARRDAMLEQLEGLPVIRPGGGWSMLMDVERLGLEAGAVSEALIEHKVAATPMTAWGQDVAPRHVRFVYSNEPVERLALLGDRVRAALDGMG